MAALLLTTLVNLIVPTRTNLQMFLWKETKSIKRVSKAGNLDKEKISTPMTNDKKKDVKTSKNKLKRERKKAAKK